MASCIGFCLYSCSQEANQRVNLKAVSLFLSPLSLVQLSGFLYIYADCANECTLHYSEAVEKHGYSVV